MVVRRKKRWNPKVEWEHLKKKRKGWGNIFVGRRANHCKASKIMTLPNNDGGLKPGGRI